MYESERCGGHDDVVADRYRLGPVLSRSAGCCAHRAYDELLQRSVRVTLVESGPTEGVSFAVRPQGWRDRDPEVAELFDAGTEYGRFFLVTHHPDDPTLAETTPPGGLDLGQLRDLGTAVATALVPRHERGVAHGGLGAGTVAFTSQGASLAEFGLLPWLARWGDVPVTPPYVAPEQRTGAESGPASDVYALGRLLGELAPQGGLRPGLRTLLVEMTAESPSARPSMAEVRRRLASRACRGPSLAAGPRGRRLGVVAAACCLVGLGIGLCAFAGEVPAVGSAGATLAATAAVPAPVIPMVPLVPVAGDAGAAGTDRTAAGDAASATPMTAPRTTTTVPAFDASPRVLDAVARTSTATSDGSGSNADEAGAETTALASHSTAKDQDRDTTSAPAPISKHTVGRTGGAATGARHDLGGVLSVVGSSLGHLDSGGSGDGGRAGTRSGTA